MGLRWSLLWQAAQNSSGSEYSFQSLVKQTSHHVFAVGEIQETGSHSGVPQAVCSRLVIWERLLGVCVCLTLYYTASAVPLRKPELRAKLGSEVASANLGQIEIRCKCRTFPLLDFGTIIPRGLRDSTRSLGCHNHRASVRLRKVQVLFWHAQAT